MTNEQRLSALLETAVAEVDPQYRGDYVAEVGDGTYAVCLLGSLACYGLDLTPEELFQTYTVRATDDDGKETRVVCDTALTNVLKRIYVGLQDSHRHALDCDCGEGRGYTLQQIAHLYDDHGETPEQIIGRLKEGGL